MQAATLSWQVRTALEMGVAGTVVFSFTDEWYTGGCDIANWAFGLVDRERRRKPAFQAVQRWYAAPGLPALAEYPKVSVVICAYNAEPHHGRLPRPRSRTSSYPAFEVIVVDDGSTDRTGKIADGFEGIHVIHQENKGLSAARNVGIAASLGEIVAFTDSDCVVDPDWLHYLVATFLQTGLPAVGGPNLPPPEDSVVAACVAASPGRAAPRAAGRRGGRAHPGLQHGLPPRGAGGDRRLRSDLPLRRRRRRRLLAAPGSRLPHRLQPGGHGLALPSQHHEGLHRPAEGLRQGGGPALLPSSRSASTHSATRRWRGRIYGGISALFSLRRPVIYGGVFGRGLFQTLYQPPSTVLSYLPFTLEWNLVGALLLAYGAVKGGWYWIGAAPVALSWACCVWAAMRARVDTLAGGLQGRLLISVLTYFGPLLRSLERYKWWVRGLTAAQPSVAERRVQALPWSWRERAFSAAFWTETALEKETILHGMMEVLAARKYFVLVDQGWSEWDLEVHGGIWSRGRIKVCAENHGGERRVLRVKCALRTSRLARGMLAGGVVAAGLGLQLGVPALAAVGAAAGVVAAVAILRDSVALGRMLYDALQGVARRARLHYAPPLDASAVGAK